MVVVTTPTGVGNDHIFIELGVHMHRNMMRAILTHIRAKCGKINSVMYIMLLVAGRYPTTINMGTSVICYNGVIKL